MDVGPDRNEDLSIAAERVLGKDARAARYRRGRASHEQNAADYLVATSGDRCDVDYVFDRLRWGGQFVFVSSRARDTEQLIGRYRNCDDFLVETDVQVICRPHPRWLRHDLAKNIMDSSRAKPP